MPAGFQSFNDEGTIKTDITTRFFRILGTIATGSSSGSIVDPNISQGVFFYYLSSVADSGGSAIFGPVVTVSGNSIYWSFTSSLQRPSTITYGVF